MKTVSAPHNIQDLGRASDRDMLSGELGVFACSWKDAKQEPESTGNCLVVVRAYEPVIALFIKGQGWCLSDTIHAGLEHRVSWWMDLPKGPR